MISALMLQNLLLIHRLYSMHTNRPDITHQPELSSPEELSGFLNKGKFQSQPQLNKHQLSHLRHGHDFEQAHEVGLLLQGHIQAHLAAAMKSQSAKNDRSEHGDNTHTNNRPTPPKDPINDVF